MKKILFATLATIAASASAADTVLVTAELTRNGELVDEFSGYTINGSPHPYRNVQLIRYNKAITNNKVKWGELEVGTTGTITPVVTSDGKIRVSFYMNYVRLVKMNSSKVGGLQVDLPQTDGYKVSSTLAMPSGGTGEYKSSENGVEYIYKVSATKQ